MLQLNEKQAHGSPLTQLPNKGVANAFEGTYLLWVRDITSGQEPSITEDNVLDPWLNSKVSLKSQKA